MASEIGRLMFQGIVLSSLLRFPSSLERLKGNFKGQVRQKKDYAASTQNPTKSQSKKGSSAERFTMIRLVCDIICLKRS